MCTEIGCPENGVKMVFSTPQKRHSLYKKQGLFPRVMEMGVIRFCCVCVLSLVQQSPGSRSHLWDLPLPDFGFSLTLPLS